MIFSGGRASPNCDEGGEGNTGRQAGRIHPHLPKIRQHLPPVDTPSSKFISTALSSSKLLPLAFSHRSISNTLIYTKLQDRMIIWIIIIELQDRETPRAIVLHHHQHHKPHHHHHHHHLVNPHHCHLHLEVTRQGDASSDCACRRSRHLE